MRFPPSFLETIAAVDGESGKIWLADLEGLTTDLMNRWDLSLVTPLPDMTFNFVAFAETGNPREKVVLKASPPDRPIWNEVRWLKHYRSVAPALLEFDELANAFLMRRCS
ncbi:MAG TPA: hypothetical protein PL182_13885, partial [Pseudobdellovibrionaceae bacterium]|nr:hypothetical protein [Pseudobdellovibrionaceae bacterium]